MSVTGIGSRISAIAVAMALLCIDTNRNSLHAVAAAKNERDPCEQLISTPGEAHGLLRQCESKGGGSGVAKGDFNGDGFADLAIGAPFEAVSNVPAAGAVHVLYGSADGLTSAGDQLWSEAVIPSGRGPEASDLFGLALASGNFDGDGFSDLAIGVSRQDCLIGGKSSPDCGAVHVLYGTATGLTTARRQYLEPLGEVPGCRFGEALVWGNFNGDDAGDLAVGSPRDTRSLFASEVGLVTVFFGHSDPRSPGLQTAHPQFLGQGGGIGTEDAGNGAEDRDHFGAVLNAGDVNGDTFDDLLVGVPDEDIGSTVDAGMIHVVFGSSTGLHGAQTLSQDTSGVGGFPEDFDRFGWAVAVGDFNNDTFADVAVGVPWEDIDDLADAGAVQVLYGSGAGLRTDNDLFLDQAALGEVDEAHDLLGWSLVAAKFNSGLFFDLAVGVPGQRYGAREQVGMVHVIYGSNLGIQTGIGLETWSLATPGITETLAEGDKFGYSLSAWNFGNGDRTDLAIGIPYYDVPFNGAVVRDAGAILVLYSQFTGPKTTGYQFWTLASPGVNGSPQTLGRLGYSLY